MEGNYSFTCNPVFINNNIERPENYSIVWRRFYSKQNLESFRNGSFNGNVVVDNSTAGITVSGNTIKITSATQSHIGYYIPSLMVGDNMELSIEMYEALLYGKNIMIII